MRRARPALDDAAVAEVVCVGGGGTPYAVIALRISDPMSAVCMEAHVPTNTAEAARRQHAHAMVSSCNDRVAAVRVSERVSQMSWSSERRLKGESGNNGGGDDEEW